MLHSHHPRAGATNAVLVLVLGALIWETTLSLDTSKAGSNEASNLTTRSISPRDLSGSFTKDLYDQDNKYCYFAAYLDWSATQNAGALTSTITVTFYIKKTKYGEYRFYNNYGPPYSITIDGTTFSGNQKFDFAKTAPVGTTQTIGSASKIVTHNSDGTRSAGLSATLESDISWGTFTVSGTAYLNAISVSVTVYFDGNGGSVSYSSKSVTKGSSYGSFPTVSRTGYTFKGWYTAASGGSQVSTSSGVSSSHTVYAQWTINQYTISFISNGGTACNSITQNYGSSFTLPTPTRDNYNFDYWCSDSALTSRYTGTTMPANSITLYAKWTIKQYTITFISNGGTACNAITQNYGTSVTLPIQRRQATPLIAGAATVL